MSTSCLHSTLGWCLGLGWVGSFSFLSCSFSFLFHEPIWKPKTRHYIASIYHTLHILATMTHINRYATYLARALTCGRVDASSSLFPYYTVDKIHDSSHITGPVTILHVVKDGKTYLWEPFKLHPAVYATTRSVYKNMLGNQANPLSISTRFMYKVVWVLSPPCQSSWGALVDQNDLCCISPVAKFVCLGTCYQGHHCFL